MRLAPTLALAAGVAIAVGCGGMVAFDGQGAGGGGITTAAGLAGGTTSTGSVASTGATSTGPGGPSTGPGGSDACVAYCKQIETACAGPNDQYASLETCLGTCGTFALGAAGDISGNTLSCRAYHAIAADEDPLTHCPHAGPSGAGVCGQPCESFCSIALQTCTGPNVVYLDQAACLAACAGFPQTGPYSASTTSGDSFACRLYHLGAATVDDTGHCPHVAASSATCQ